MAETPNSVYAVIRDVAKEIPDKVAITFGDTVYSYAELLSLIENAAKALVAERLGKGDRFAVYAQNTPEILAAYFASSKIGAVMVPINPNMTAEEVTKVMEHCDAGILFHDQTVTEAARAAISSSRRRSLSALFEGAGSPAPEERGLPDDDFAIVYTSGSTGTPKAIVLSHRAQVNVLCALAEMWGLSAQDTTVVGLPLGYLYGLSTAAAAGLASGGKLVLLRRFHPGETLAALVSSRATVFHGVPTMFTMMLEYAEQQGLHFDLSFMRALICAGAPLADELKLRFEACFNMHIQNYYALSECTPVFGKLASNPRPMPLGVSGQLAPMAAALIIDDQGNQCPQGEVGELLVKGAGLMTRYHNDPVNSAAVFADGWFKTGDIARESPPGYYTIVGRKKDIIIRGGANISPPEVEAVLIEHPAVQNAAVIGLPDRIFGEVPAAAIVLRPSAEVAPDELAKFASEKLAQFKVPTKFAYLAELPLGQTGKVDKNALRKKWEEIFK